MGRISSHAPISSSSRRRLARWLVGSPIRVVERDLILETLAHNHGNRTVSARLLGVSIRTLRNRITEYSAEARIPMSQPVAAPPSSAIPKDKAAAMPAALARMRPVAASDCGS